MHFIRNKFNSIVIKMTPVTMQWIQIIMTGFDAVPDMQDKDKRIPMIQEHFGHTILN